MNFITKLALFSLVSFNFYASASSCRDLFQGQTESLFKNQTSFSAPRVQTRNNDVFSVITWNAHKLADKKFIPDLAALGRDADVILMQEALHSTDMQKNFTTHLDLNFSFHKSFNTTDKEATGVMTASRYGLEKNQTLVSPNTEPFTFTPKVSGYSAIRVPEIGTIHIINTHGLNFNIGYKFEAQVKAIAEFIRRLDGPVIWAGDFNTWDGWRKDVLIAATRSLGLSHLRPANDRRFLQLDHIFARGLEALDVQVLDQVSSSDHYPIKATFRKK